MLDIPKLSAKNTNFFAEILKPGVLTCDFLAVVEGQSLPPRRPEDRCNELRVAARLIACGARAEGRSFHAFCRKIRLNPRRRWLRA